MFIDVVFAVNYNKEANDQMIAQLAKNPLHVEMTDSSDFTGNIYADKLGYLFTSIPYDQGFTVTVDGKKVKTEKLAGAFLGIPLDEGEHTIHFKFRPKGLIEGRCVTVVSLLIMIIWVVARKNVGRKQI